MYELILRNKLNRLVKQQNKMGKFSDKRTEHYLYLIDQADGPLRLMELRDKIYVKIVENYDSALLQSV